MTEPLLTHSGMQCKALHTTYTFKRLVCTHKSACSPQQLTNDFLYLLFLFWSVAQAPPVSVNPLINNWW